MPENVTGFQPTRNLKKSLIDLAYFDIWPRRSPTFFREEPFFQTLAVARHRKGFPARPHMHIKPVLRYVNPNKNLVHLYPSLRNRARLAAHATVRVRWNGGRSPVLRYGLQGPRMRRSPVRHRIGQLNRVGHS